MRAPTLAPCRQTITPRLRASISSCKVGLDVRLPNCLIRKDAWSRDEFGGPLGDGDVGTRPTGVALRAGPRGDRGVGHGGEADSRHLSLAASSGHRAAQGMPGWRPPPAAPSPVPSVNRTRPCCSGPTLLGSRFQGGGSKALGHASEDASAQPKAKRCRTQRRSRVRGHEAPGFRERGQERAEDVAGWRRAVGAGLCRRGCQRSRRRRVGKRRC